MKYNSHARENQDRFVVAVLDGKKNGTYVEVGGYLPIEWNNTFMLEKEFGWTGISLELFEKFSSQWNGIRSNPCITCDATTTDLNSLIEENNLPKVIDFLQLDIDPAASTLKVLENIDFDKHSFRIITFEHDVYRGEDTIEIRNKSREILQGHGYTLLIPDVSHGDLKFEDWYIKEDLMPSDTWKKFINVNPVFNTEDMLEETKNLLSPKDALIYLPGGLGDILFMLKLSHLFIEDGYKVTWPVFHEFKWLKDYIPEINWVVLEDWDIEKPLPNIDFIGKEYYSNKTSIFQTDDFLYYNGHGHGDEHGPEMQRKYNVIGADWRDWRDYVKFERNIDKENELFYNVLGLKDGEDYVYVNRHWQTRPTKEVYTGISDDPETYGCKVVQHDIIEGFSVFDWCKVLENAKGFYMIETSLNYILESPFLFDKVKDKPLHLWHRTGDWSTVKPLHNLPWVYESL